MSWLKSVRTFLRDLRRFKSASPDEMQLEQLHIETFDINDQHTFDNIEPVWDILMSDNCLSEVYCLETLLRGVKGALFFSECVSSLLASWITTLSQEASHNFHIARNKKLRIENDNYSSGIPTLLTLSSSHKTKRIIPLLSIVIRERNRPEHLLSSAELYVAFAMAAMHCSLEDIKTINVRVLIVYSYWVQVVTVTTTPLYIKSIIQGSECIMGKMAIHRTRWFNFLDPSGRLGILLSASEDINLGLSPEDTNFYNKRKRPKSTLEHVEKLEKLRSKRRKSKIA
ncbi:2856d557-0eb4-4541-88e7-be29367e0041 [Sclerotinia trifoliorum]|uniref:2856d557-0eb4-4541-88e7-be29367e0041 n=1 Tax=Sclerotinia trifoliorum TaxID=28548 RepID=A0A8H2VQS6_9HELO|nr:2856d557-0eb4-4541-88e7-be29367e0041 [Sclerotinia trifoliorum]